MTINVRFAPSPTGYLHVGNVRTALINWLFAKRHGGRFLLRIDDTDAERSKSEYTDAIREDLTWLGLAWDDEKHQSPRMQRYHEAAGRLKASGRLYACYETPEELEMRRKLQLGRGLPPIYDRASLKLTDAQKHAYEAEGRKPHWRFLLESREETWNDLIRGPIHMQATSMSDPVLLRADGVPVYTLASVVDDGDFAITHIIRGEDHVSNTAVQIQLFEALGFTLPQFAHLSLLKTKEGELSKRTGGNDIRGLRAQGIVPMSINSMLARLGTSDSIEPFDSMKPLLESFDFAKFGKAPAIYDGESLLRLNQKLLHHLPYSAVRAQLPAIDETFWLSVRGNISALHEANEWWAILHHPVAATLLPEEKEFLRTASEYLPEEPWTENTWNEWMNAVKAATNRKGKDLFMPIRKAITGMEHGPELKALLPLLGKSRTAERLRV